MHQIRLMTKLIRTATAAGPRLIVQPASPISSAPLRITTPNRSSWVADLTFDLGGFAYVAFVTDAYARRILLSGSAQPPHGLDAIEQAIWTANRRRTRPEGALSRIGDLVRTSVSFGGGSPRQA